MCVRQNTGVRWLGIGITRGDFVPRRIQKILDAEKYARIPDPKFPRFGEPLDTIAVENIGTERNPIPKVHHRFMPHLIDSESTGFAMGHFLNYWVETEERCWEITAIELATIRAHKKR